MSRRIELISAMIACALGLIWLAYDVNALQSIWVVETLGGIGAGHSAAQPIGFNSVGLYFTGMAIVVICVAVGAYLHAVQRLLPGLLMVWVAAMLATIGIALYLIAPWQFMSAQFIYFVRVWAYATVTPLGVLAVVFAWVAAVAGLPIRRDVGRSITTAETVRKRQGPEPFAAP